MASTSELWAIAKAKAKNPGAETANRALQGIYGGYQQGKVDDRQMLEDKFKEIQRMRQIMAWKQQEAQLKEQRSGTIDQLADDPQDYSEQGRTMSFLESMKVPGDDKSLTSNERKINKMLSVAMPDPIKGTTTTTINKDGIGMTIKEGRDRKEELLDLQIEDYKSKSDANRALAEKRRADAKNVGKGGGKNPLAGDIHKIVVQTQKEVDENMNMDRTELLDTQLQQAKAAERLAVAGKDKEAQKIIANIISEMESTGEEMTPEKKSWLQSLKEIFVTTDNTKKYSPEQETLISDNMKAYKESRENVIAALKVRKIL